MIITRFAPSPTGFLHIGSARTALFSWVYAKKNKGKFILRIEDTDIERSTQESVKSILDAMNWLGLNCDEGPYFQTHRMDNYKVKVKKLLDENKAYYCYCSKEELDEMRDRQRQSGLKPKYDRRCLHNPNKKNGVLPVVRFKNPDTGSVIWDDMVKGRIEICNEELDDLIIARSDGTPTYNFCVVIDDLDMKITHVIRGDDHVNNTPRQINIFKAFDDAQVPLYAHVPMILREDGQKMSKRRDAVSVMQYKGMGVLPEALLNYLARLCWGHGDDEIFSLEQFSQWFDLSNVSGSPAKFDTKKLFWINSEHLKTKSTTELAQLISGDLTKRGITNYQELQLDKVIELVRSRVDNLVSLADECEYIYRPLKDNQEEMHKHLTESAIVILNEFANGIFNIEWSLDSIKQYIKYFCTKNNVTMPMLGMPLRMKLCGTTKTPSFDAVIYLLGKQTVLKRLNS